MASILNVSCPVCKEVFKNSDTIYSTSCGHIFHFTCLNDWKSRSTFCPQCRGSNPTSHRLFLNFDENRCPSLENELHATKNKVLDLTKNIEKKNIMYQELRRIEEKNRRIFEKRIQNQSEVIQKLETENVTKENAIKVLSEEKNELQAQLESVLNQTENNGSILEQNESLKAENTSQENATKLLSEEKAEHRPGLESTEEQETENITNNNGNILENKIQDLLELNKRLKAKTTSQENALNALSKENTDLQSQLESLANGSSQWFILQEKNKVLEQKLKLISLELEKEISKNIQLTMDKMKAQCNAESKQRRASTAKKSKNNKSKPINLDPARALVIKNYTPTGGVVSLENEIIFIAASMDFFLHKNEITKNFYKNMQLFVEFKSMETKSTLMRRQDKLKTNALTKDLILEEYTCDIKSLFNYANTKLRGRVFGYIVLQGNSIVAKRNLHDIDTMEITSRTQVDDLLKRKQTEEPKIEVPN
ncbi:E3 ubiquitin-protein ligase TRAIP [Stomoxys calcitrans]|uniref:E3 ubiquitin-protein ligase TRAIP n=1 Tax=Stomoxys calcitrans TaxID=35570 RepID=UPI0027E3980C|nr:E3 ubiquitin-protein ligase TRAIP [Stomoxys calcitrans]